MQNWLRESSILAKLHLDALKELHPLPILRSILSFVRCGGTSLYLRVSTFRFFYYKYAMMIEDKFGGGAIRTNSSVYAMPQADLQRRSSLRSGIDRATPARRLYRGTKNKVGYYTERPMESRLLPDPQSYFQSHTAVVQIEADRVANILSQTENHTTNHYWLEPELITNLFDADRENAACCLLRIPKRIWSSLDRRRGQAFFQTRRI